MNGEQRTEKDLTECVSNINITTPVDTIKRFLYDLTHICVILTSTVCLVLYIGD